MRAGLHEDAQRVRAAVQAAQKKTAPEWSSSEDRILEANHLDPLQPLIGITAPALPPPLIVLLDKTKSAAATYARLWSELNKLAAARAKTRKTLVFRFGQLLLMGGLFLFVMTMFNGIFWMVAGIAIGLIGVALTSALSPQGEPMRLLEPRVVASRHAFNALASALDAALATLEPA